MPAIHWFEIPVLDLDRICILIPLDEPFRDEPGRSLADLLRAVTMPAS